MKNFFILALIILISAAHIGIAVANDQSDVEGTYVGQQIGRGRGQVYTLILLPKNRASIAITIAPGTYAQVSTGSWKLMTPNDLQISVAGNAGNGMIEFSRFGDQLTAISMDFELIRSLSLQLIKQSPIPGTYTAVSSGAKGLQTLTLQLNPDGSACLKIEPSTQQEVLNGKWEQIPNGNLKLSLSKPDTSDKIILYRSSTNMFRMLEWNQETWGKAALVFVKG